MGQDIYTRLSRRQTDETTTDGSHHPSQRQPDAIIMFPIPMSDPTADFRAGRFSDDDLGGAGGL